MKNKGGKFLQGALVLAGANLLVKLIGAFFKVPLYNLIGEDGNGIFNVAYQIYTFMFIIATAGFPIAVSKMVAESIANGICKVISDKDVPELHGGRALRYGKQRYNADGERYAAPKYPRTAHTPLRLCTLHYNASYKIRESVEKTRDEHDQCNGCRRNSNIVGVEKCKHRTYCRKRYVIASVAQAVRDTGF